jgi:hypothetical protein
VPDHSGNFKQFDIAKNVISRNYGKLHNHGIENVIISGDVVIISGAKGLLMQYSIKDDEEIMKHVKDHEDMRRRSELFDKAALEESVKKSGFAVGGTTNSSTIKKSSVVH